MQLIIFTQSNAYVLQENVNDWLSTHSMIEVIEMRYACASCPLSGGITFEYSVAILYK